MLCWQEQHKKGLGVMCKGISVFSFSLSFGIMGLGAVILSGIFELSSLAPVKGIKVSRAIMTLETKGVFLILCSCLEIHYMASILQCLPIETAEMEAGASICGSGVHENHISSRRT
jgi:hypothetical protein